MLAPFGAGHRRGAGVVDGTRPAPASGRIDRGMATARTIKLLKPGTFTDIRGTKVTFTRDDLAGIAASYDPDSDPAPLVIGHPQVDAPAYGWVGGLAFDGDHLVASPSRIAPAFAEAVDAGHYAKVSAQLYAPTHPSNPKPGGWYLQHVGFLGAQAPGVKGLGTVAFSAADDAAATTIIIDEEPAVADDTISLSEHQEQVSTLQQQIDDMTEAARLRDEQDAANARAAQHAQNVAFAEGLIAAGTLAPAAKAKVITLMDQLDAATVVSFGEGDDVLQETPLAAFRSLFDAANPVIALGEHAPASPSGAPAGGAVTVSFAAPPGYSVAPDQAALHARAREIQSADPALTFWDAFTRARTEAAAG